MRAPIPSHSVDVGCSMRLDFFGCLSLRTVLRDVPSVLHVWRASGNSRLQSMTSLFSFVVGFFRHLLNN